jgi:hypothetical protein
MDMAQKTKRTLLDAFEKMVYNNGRISVMISRFKDKAENSKGEESRLCLRMVKQLEKLAAISNSTTANLKEKLTMDDLMEVVERIDVKKAFDEISDNIHKNVEITFNNMNSIDEILKSMDEEENS